MEYLHCSSNGSYWVECRLVERRPYSFVRDASTLEFLKAYHQGAANYVPPYSDTDVGIVIEYVDPNTLEQMVEWVPVDKLRDIPMGA